MGSSPSAKQQFANPAEESNEMSTFDHISCIRRMVPSDSCNQHVKDSISNPKKGCSHQGLLSTSTVAHNPFNVHLAIILRASDL